MCFQRLKKNKWTPYLKEVVLLQKTVRLEPEECMVFYKIEKGSEEFAALLLILRE